MKLFRWIWGAIKAVVMLTGLGVIGLAVLVLVLQPWERESANVPDGAYLDLTWKGRLGEKPVNGNVAELARDGGLSLFRMMRAISTAAKDERVAGIIIDLSRADVPLAHAEALALHIQNFRASGKPTYAFSSGWDLGRYTLGASFDQVWMPASGHFGVGGLALVSPYAAELANELGIEAQIEKRKEFKSAADMLLSEGMTPNQRSANQKLLDQLWSASTGLIKLGRRAFKDRSDADISGDLTDAFWNADIAKERELVDVLAHRAAFREQISGPLFKVRKYLPEALKHPEGSVGTVAYVAAGGTIREGRTSALDGDTIADESLIEDLVSASRDPDIDAIIVRIDSGGGGYTPSDAILDTIAGIDKPVVASMGSLAGSGGYMIAMAADRIVAHTTTITGSIGVVGGKIVIEDLLRDLGVNINSVSSGPFAGANSPLKSYTPAERGRLIERIDAIYAAFTGGVAKHRNLSADQVERAAQGRIWTGVQARDLKLVDDLGGPDTAAAAVAELLQAGDGGTLAIVEYPHLSNSARIASAVGLGVKRLGVAAGWLSSPEAILDRLKDEGGIRAEMPYMLLE
jgi:protease-4